jgi:hypothetical protein
MVDILIIRNNCDEVSKYTNWFGKGLKEYLESKGFSVVDLSDADASPENVSYWLDNVSKRVTKAVIAFDHGSNDAFWGEKNNQLAAVIDTNNVANLASGIHVYTFACSTNANDGVGQKAVESGCYSWLGYIEPAWILLSEYQPLKDCVWSYIVAMVEGKTMEECEATLVQAYKDRESLHWIFKTNRELLLLRKSQEGMKINTHNRITGWRYNQKIIGQWAYGPAARWSWVYVKDLGWKLLWNTYDPQVEVLTMMASHARVDDRFVSFYEENGVIKEMYVW